MYLGSLPKPAGKNPLAERKFPARPGIFRAFSPRCAAAGVTPAPPGCRCRSAAPSCVKTIFDRSPNYRVITQHQRLAHSYLTYPVDLDPDYKTGRRAVRQATTPAEPSPARTRSLLAIHRWTDRIPVNADTANFPGDHRHIKLALFSQLKYQCRAGRSCSFNAFSMYNAKSKRANCDTWRLDATCRAIFRPCRSL
jgi:hypothetical protein